MELLKELTDVFLHIFHLSIIVINLFGWIFKKTRPLHKVVFSVTVFSWGILGFFYGFGYCFLTEWHWQLKRSLGERDLPYSYITYWTNNILGLGLSEKTVELWSLIFFLVVFVASLYLYIVFPMIKRSKARQNPGQ